jgi:predicted ATPase
MFKHALTQEVVYNGLLKKERKEIHERIGVVMEGLFQDRLPEFYETLALHFRTLPLAARRAEAHLTKAIEVYREIGGKGMLASAHLDLGNLYKAKRRNEQAREHIAEAVRLFGQCEAEIFLKQAKEALASLE